MRTCVLLCHVIYDSASEPVVGAFWCCSDVRAPGEQSWFVSYGGRHFTESISLVLRQCFPFYCRRWCSLTFGSKASLSYLYSLSVSLSLSLSRPISSSHLSTSQLQQQPIRNYLSSYSCCRCAFADERFHETVMQPRTSQKWIATAKWHIGAYNDRVRYTVHWQVVD